MTTALPKSVSSADLATLLGITKRSINSLAERGALSRLPDGQFNLAEGLQAYVLHREDVIAAEHGLGDFGKARAELYQERVKVARMKREELEKTLVHVDEVFRTWTGIATVIRQRILGLPPKLAPRLLGQRHAADVQKLLTEEVHEVLEELSKTQVRSRNAEEDEDGPEDI